MSGYQRINFKDQNVERPKTYDVTNNPDGSITLIESFGNVEELGTPINQENMNHIEDGIDAVSFSKYNIDAVYKKDDLATDIQDNQLKIIKSLKDNNFGHLPTELDFWEEVKISGGGGGFNLFDTILKDHVLTYKETKGLALQGTYVYKEALVGLRYGYPDFYNKVVEEYQNSSNTKQYLKSNVNLVGSLNDNQGVLSGFNDSNYAQLLSAMPTDATDWEIVIKYNAGANPTSTTNKTFFGCTTNYRIILSVASSKFRVYLSSNGSSWDLASAINGTYTVTADTDYYVKCSRVNGEKYVLSYSLDGIEFIDDIVVTTTANIVSDTYCLGRTSTTGQYATGSVDLNKSYININGERWWNGTEDLHYKQNSNGHIFYDISEKDKVDEIFASTGSAWFYGVDTENERVFLPRTNSSNWLNLSKTIPVWALGQRSNSLGTITALTSDYENNKSLVEIGEKIRAGLSRPMPTQPSVSITNGKLTKGTKASDDGGAMLGVNGDGNLTSYTYNDCSMTSHQAIGFAQYADVSYLGSDVPQYLYICVGNTTSFEGMTEVVNQGMEILEQVNQGLETKANTDFSNITDVAKNIISEQCSPDTSNAVYVSTSPSNNSSYTAPKDGWFNIMGITSTTTSAVSLAVNGTHTTSAIVSADFTSSANKLIAGIIPVSKNDTVNIGINDCKFSYGTYENLGLWFIPKKGAQ